MATSMELIKQLRERTGVGIDKCKKALQAAGDDLQGAIDHLRKQGIASAVKKEGRETSEGAIGTAQSAETVAFVEINAETDFVVQNARFGEFLATIAEQISEQLPKSLEQLLELPYAKDPSLSIDQHRAVLVQALGENIQVRRFEAFAKGRVHSIGIYVHSGAKIAALVQINGSASEQELARDIAMHVAASSPEFLSPESVPASVLDKEREIALTQLPGKPPEIAEKIVAGKIRAFCQNNCLTEQEYIRDSGAKIFEVVQKRAKELGHSLKIAQFVRWRVGG